MSAPEPTVPLRKSLLISREVLLWSTAAVLAAGYLVTLGLAPDVIDDLTPTTNLDPQSVQGQRAVARMANDVKALRDSFDHMQLELAKVKTEVAGFSESHKALSQEVAAFTNRPSSDPSTSTQVSAEAPSTSPAGKQVPAQAPITLPAPGIVQAPGTEAALPANTSVQPKVINADNKDALTSLETGSVDPAKTTATPVIDFGPAVVKKTPKPIGVQISSGASVDSLRLSWSLLADKHADTLRNLEARYLDKGNAANPNYDLVAGPIKSRAEAVRVCKSLAARNVPCKVSEFTGESL